MEKNDFGIILDTPSKNKIWCMLMINNINYNNISLNLVALGFKNKKIVLINLSIMKIHQEIDTEGEVYSLAQFKNDPNYLICSLSNGTMIIYLLKDNIYYHYQTLQKPEGNVKEEFNKVIVLSDGNLATAESRAISIWKSNLKAENKKFEFFKEIITGNDTCQLVEVNPQIIACAMYDTKLINIYIKKGDDYSLLKTLSNIENHGNNSNSMAKINDKLFCCGGKKGVIYIISIEPIQVIKKINLDKLGKYDDKSFIQFLHNSNDGFIFTSFNDVIFQFKIIYDKKGNFIDVKEYNVIEDGENNEAIITNEYGEIFYKKKINHYYYDEIFLVLKNYYIKKKYNLKSKLGKFIKF